MQGKRIMQKQKSYSDKGNSTDYSLHMPVMLEQLCKLASTIRPMTLYIDCTIGAGGHAEALLKEYKELRCIGIDADPDACNRASERLKPFADRLSIINGYYDEVLSEIRNKRASYRFPGNVSSCLCNEKGELRPSLIFFDLGLSMYQLKSSGKGFSFYADEPLDMRFSPSAQYTAEELVNQLPETKLANEIFKYGEERFSRQIAHAIVETRKKEYIYTSSQLASIIYDAVHVKYRNGRIHPATRTFQALRILVNDELNRLERACIDALELLGPGAVCAVITFHSLEDRIIKHIFAEKAKNSQFSLEWKKPITPTEEELRNNPSSRSAKFRAIRANDREAQI